MNIKKYLIISVLLFAAGCGVWTNFTTYFNRYYNTVTAFDAAMEEVNNTERELFEFKEPKIAGQAAAEFKKVIEKGSNILQFNQESDYVDDALYMTGVAFYYQEEYAKALRKFQELSALPKNELKLQTKLWIAKSEMQMRNFERGMKILASLKDSARAEGDEEVLVQAYISEIRYLKYTESYATAVGLCDKLLSESTDEALNAEITYETGKMYLLNNDLNNAAKAFGRVEEFDPTYIIEFNSLLELARIKKQQGDIEGSLQLLEELKIENKFADFGDIVGLEIGWIYLETNKIEDAYREFTIVDTTFKSTESAGVAAFNRAEIWEKHFVNFDSAMVYYDRALASKAPNEYKIKARKKTQVFVQLLGLKEDLLNYDKQLVWVLEPEVFVQDSIDYETSKHEMDSLQTQAGNSAGRNPGGGRNPRARNGNLTNQSQQTLIKPLRPKISSDSLITLVADTKFKLGNLFFSDLERSDSAYFYYNDLLQNYPPDQNRPKLLFTMGSYYLTRKDTAKADSMFQFVYDNYQGDPMALEAAAMLGIDIESTETDPAVKAYAKAEDIYYKNQFRTAAWKYYDIYIDYPSSILAPQALYTSGWIYENDLNESDSAAIRYDTLTTKYRSSEYARSILPKLNIYKAEQKKIQDSIAAAQKRLEDSLNVKQKPDSVSTIKDNKPADNQDMDEQEKAEQDREKGIANVEDHFLYRRNI